MEFDIWNLKIWNLKIRNLNSGIKILEICKIRIEHWTLNIGWVGGWLENEFLKKTPSPKFGLESQLGTSDLEFVNNQLLCFWQQLLTSIVLGFGLDFCLDVFFSLSLSLAFCDCIASVSIFPFVAAPLRLENYTIRDMIWSTTGFWVV